jgi:hypothetical protein
MPWMSGGHCSIEWTVKLRTLNSNIGSHIKQKLERNVCSLVSDKRPIPRTEGTNNAKYQQKKYRRLDVFFLMVIYNNFSTFCPALLSFLILIFFLEEQPNLDR